MEAYQAGEDLVQACHTEDIQAAVVEDNHREDNLVEEEHQDIPEADNHTVAVVEDNLVVADIHMVVEVYQDIPEAAYHDTLVVDLEDDHVDQQDDLEDVPVDVQVVVGLVVDLVNDVR